jgi:autotransporter-associated beta strand protein
MAIYTWNNAAGGAWTSGSNWTGGDAPPNGSDIDLSTLDITADRTITLLPSGITLNSITASDTAVVTNYNRWFLSGGPLVTPINISTPSTLVGGTYPSGREALVFGTALDVSGSGDVNKYGPGMLRFDVTTGQKSFTGNINIYNGWVIATDNNVFKGQINIYGNSNTGINSLEGTGVISLNSTINIFGNNFNYGIDDINDPDTTLTGQINLYTQNTNIYLGSGGIRTISGQINEITSSSNIITSGSLVLSGISKNTGYFSVIAGNLNIGTGSLASASLGWNTTGTFTTTAGCILGGLIGSNDLTSSVAYSVGNVDKNETFNGSMQGAGAVTKIGTGEWYNYNQTFSTRTGATTVTNGALRVGYDDTLGQTSTGGLTISNNGTVKFDAPYPPAKAWSIGGTPSYYGNAHIIFLSNSAVSSSITLTSDVVITASSGLDLTGSGNITSAGYNLSLGSGSYYNISKILALGSGGLSSSGSYIVLGNANTFTGYYGNDGGNTFLANTSALSTATVDQISGTISFGVTTATIGGIYNSSANFDTTGLTTLSIGTTANANGVYSGVISGSAGLTKTGSSVLSLRNSNLYTGVTTVSAGTLELANANPLPNTAGITVALNQTLQVAPSIAGGVISIPCTTTFNGGNFTIA